MLYNQHRHEFLFSCGVFYPASGTLKDGGHGGGNNASCSLTAEGNTSASWTATPLAIPSAAIATTAVVKLTATIDRPNRAQSHRRRNNNGRSNGAHHHSHCLHSNVNQKLPGQQLHQRCIEAFTILTTPSTNLDSVHPYATHTYSRYTSSNVTYSARPTRQHQPAAEGHLPCQLTWRW